MLALAASACAGRQDAETLADPEAQPGDRPEESGPPSAEPSAAEDTPSDARPGEPPTSGEAACRAYANDSEADPLRRWVSAFPIRVGGVVMVFNGPAAEQMEVELVLEMAAVGGYEDYVCGSAVVVWVPGFECGAESTALARRIEGGTTMSHAESACFRLDEIRPRIREECGRGRLPAEVCQ